MPDLNKTFELLMQGLILIIPAIIFSGLIWSIIKNSFPEMRHKNKGILQNLDALEKLKKLHNDGVIDDNEFKDLKSVIIVDIHDQ
jgi:hypothetical protein